jgi:hypothetical protein
VIYAFRGATLTVANSTFSNNSATGTSGGLFNLGVTTVTNSTFERTKIYNYTVNNPATLTVYNSIVAGPNDWDFPRCGDGQISDSNNLADNASCGPAFTNSPTILLGALGSFGGSTQTNPLLPGSSATDTEDDTFCPATDQRGLSRPQGTGCDIGAFESQGFSLSGLTGTPQSTLATTAFGMPLGLSLTANASAELVDGGLVTFTAPSSGASATLVGSPATISGGLVSITATANNLVGSYAVTAAASGVAPVNF